MDTKPRMFIGSSSESLALAQALASELRESIQAEVWESVFRPGHYTLEELSRKVAEVDFAAFILGQDDTTDSRGEITVSPRDNVVYEAGLFAGRLGVSRVFLLVDAAGTKIPSDWKGLGYLTFDLYSGSPDEAVRQAATRIHGEVSDWRSKFLSAPEHQIKGHWWQFVVNRKDGAVVSLMNIAPVAETADWELRGTSWTQNGEAIATYWSRAAALDRRDRKLFYYWEGEHPFDNSIPAFFGVGEVHFDDARDGAITRGKGWYSSTPLASLDETLRKSTIYRRADASDIDITAGNDRAALSRLIKSKLDEWSSL